MTLFQRIDCISRIVVARAIGVILWFSSMSAIAIGLMYLTIKYAPPGSIWGQRAAIAIMMIVWFGLYVLSYFIMRRLYEPFIKRLLRIAVVSAAVFLAATPASAKLPDEPVNNITVVEGEGLHYVPVSLDQINRISCPGEIGDPIYSKEKRMEVSRYGKEAFVKLLPERISHPDGNIELRYSKMPREVFVECAGKIFSLTLVPRSKIPSQNIVLKAPFADVREAERFEKAGDYERTVHALIRSAWLGQVPDGYAPVSIAEKPRRYASLDMEIRKRYVGSRFVVDEWRVTAKENIELSERQFVPELNSPRAVAIGRPKLDAGEEARLIVVRENVDAPR